MRNRVYCTRALSRSVLQQQALQFDRHVLDDLMRVMLVIKGTRDLCLLLLSTTFLSSTKITSFSFKSTQRKFEGFNVA